MKHIHTTYVHQGITDHTIYTPDTHPATNHPATPQGLWLADAPHSCVHTERTHSIHNDI